MEVLKLRGADRKVSYRFTEPRAIVLIRYEAGTGLLANHCAETWIFFGEERPSDGVAVQVATTYKLLLQFDAIYVASFIQERHKVHAMNPQTDQSQSQTPSRLYNHSRVPVPPERRMAMTARVPTKMGKKTVPLEG